MSTASSRDKLALRFYGCTDYASRQPGANHNTCRGLEYLVDTSISQEESSKVVVVVVVVFSH